MEGSTLLSPQDVLTTSASQLAALGQLGVTGDGRLFRYARAGASAITRGKLQLAPTPKTNHHNLATAAAAIGATEVTVTLGATAAVANEYADGLLQVNDAIGEGVSYRILSHPAANASAALVVTLKDPIKTLALTAASECSLIHNSYRRVIEGTSATQIPAGVPLLNIALEEFGWVQTHGPAPVLAQGTVTLGAPVIAGSVAGSVTDNTDVTAPIAQIWVGFAPIAGVDTEYRAIYLTID